MAVVQEVQQSYGNLMVPSSNCGKSVSFLLCKTALSCLM